MADRFGSSKEKSYRSRNRAIAALVQSSTNVVTTDIDGLDSAATIALINNTATGLDSAQVLAIAGDAGLDSAAVLSIALSGYGERKTFIQSSAPTSDFQVGDFWWDRDGNTLYKATASSSYTSYPLPAGSTSQYPGLALDARGNHLTKSPGYTSANFTLSGAGTQSYPNTGVFATHGGTYPWEPFDASNTGVKYTLTTPTTFYAFSTGNTDAGWIYKIEYEDGSYAISNNASPIVEPTSLSWFDASGNSLNKTVAFGNGLRILTHPTGVKCSAFVVARGSYGTRNYDFWIFFQGADYWNEVGEMYLDSDTVRSYVTADHVNSLGITAGLDSAAVTSLIDSSYINARIGAGTVEAIVDSAYIQLRDRFQDSAGIISIVDSAYVQARQTDIYRDSGFITNIIDSDYIQTRQSNVGGGGGVDSAATITLINSVIDSSSRAFTYTYTATANQTTFSGADNNNNTLAYSTGNIITFLNGILLVDSDDYVATTGNSIVLNSAASLNDILNVVKFRSSGSGGNLSHQQYKYTASSPTTTFSGNDDNGNSLSYETGELQVYLNGILLIDSQDYVASNGTSVVLTTATDSNDVLAVSRYLGGNSTVNQVNNVFRSTHFVYTTASPTTTITGSDDNSATLSYIENQIQVFQNGILLIDSADYTATNGTSIVLGTATDSGDTVVITAFRGAISSGLDSADVLAIAGGGGGGGTDSATVIALSGELKGGMFRINPQSLSINTTIDSDENAHVAGPISFDSGVVLTINGNLVIS